MHYRSDSATENCLIILLIKCEPEKNSFFSPRAQLGWQDFKVQLFHKGKQVRPSVQTENGSLKTVNSLGVWPLTFLGKQNFTLGNVLSKKPPLVRDFSSKSNHFSRTLFTAFTCLLCMPNSKWVPTHSHLFHKFFLSKEGNWAQKITLQGIRWWFVKASFQHSKMIAHLILKLKKLNMHKLCLKVQFTTENNARKRKTKLFRCNVNLKLFFIKPFRVLVYESSCSLQ